MNSAGGEAIREAYERWLMAEQRKREPAEPRTYVYASGYRRCAYAMFLDCRYPERINDPDTLARFRRGDDFELSQTINLHQVGRISTPPFQVVEGQRRAAFEDRCGRKIISGRIDAIIQFKDESEQSVLEIKSGESVKRVRCIGDMFMSIWTERQVMQLLVYLLNLGMPHGIMLLDRPGVPTVLDVYLEDHLDEAEMFYARAEVVCAALRGETEPPPKSPGINCNACNHYHRCLPDEWLRAVDHITDVEIVEAARTVSENAKSARDHNRAQQILKTRLRGVEAALIGDEYRYEGSYRASVTIPNDIREKHGVRNEKGSWHGRVEKL